MAIWTEDEVEFLKGLATLGVYKAFARIAEGDNSLDRLRELGHALWGISYKYGLKDDSEEGATIGKMVQRAVSTIMAANLGIHPDDVVMTLPPSEVIQASFATHWVDQACPEIIVGHKYASALMSTKAASSTLNDVKPPWRAFLIQVPEGLLHIWNDREEAPNEIKYVCVYHRYCSLRERDEWAYYTLTPGSHLSMWRFGVSAEQLVLESINDNPYQDNVFCDELTDMDGRASLMIGRLIINTCIAMTDRDQVKPVGGSHRKSKRPSEQIHRSGPPPVRIFQLGRKINLNCIEAVRDYVLHGAKRGKSGPATVQTLVCGHHKLQPYGPKNPDGTWGPQRKVIWREPFWRGPEDGPIVVRPHEVGTSKKERKRA